MVKQLRDPLKVHLFCSMFARTCPTLRAREHLVRAYTCATRIIETVHRISSRPFPMRMLHSPTTWAFNPLSRWPWPPPRYARARNSRCHVRVEERMTSLFDSLDVGRMTLPNRIIMAPLTRSRAGRDGVPTSLHETYYTAARLLWAHRHRRRLPHGQPSDFSGPARHRHR